MVYGIVGIAVCVNTTVHRFGGLAYIEAGRNRLIMHVCVSTLPYSWLHRVFRTGGSCTRGKGYLWTVQNSIMRNYYCVFYIISISMCLLKIISSLHSLVSTDYSLCNIVLIFFLLLSLLLLK